MTVPYNDFKALELALKRSAHEVAAILVAPVYGNCAAINVTLGII